MSTLPIECCAQHCKLLCMTNLQNWYWMWFFNDLWLTELTTGLYCSSIMWSLRESLKWWENGTCSMLLLFWLATNCSPLLMCSFWTRESIWKELECMKRSSKPTPVIQSQEIQKPWQSYKSSWLEYYVTGNETHLLQDDISEPSPTTKSCTEVRF